MIILKRAYIVIIIEFKNNKIKERENAWVYVCNLNKLRVAECLIPPRLLMVRCGLRFVFLSF